MALRTAEWPALPLQRWRDTYATLHMWTQIVGKVCLALTPLKNHYWNIAFQVTPAGLATPVMFHRDRTLQITFDFVRHELRFEVSDGECRRIPLEPRSVADFYALVMKTLEGLGIQVRIWTMPVEIPDPIRFTEDTIHHTYDPAQAHAFWSALVAMKPVFEDFGCQFLGKCSPVHFFWGSFDLAVTRFSGRPAPPHPGGVPHLPDVVAREAYSQEVSSLGFWPGNEMMPEPIFYSYAYPAPDGFADAKVKPAAASYNAPLKEFVLPYEAMRQAASPDEALLEFAQSTYDAASALGKWDRAALEEKKPHLLSRGQTS